MASCDFCNTRRLAPRTQRHTGRFRPNLACSAQVIATGKSGLSGLRDGWCRPATTMNLGHHPYPGKDHSHADHRNQYRQHVARKLPGTYKYIRIGRKIGQNSDRQPWPEPIPGPINHCTDQFGTRFSIGCSGNELNNTENIRVHAILFKEFPDQGGA